MVSTKIKKMIDINGTFILMHKNIEVCKIELVDDGLVKTVLIFNNGLSHMPLGTSNDIHKFRTWWNDRAIPKTRNNAKTALEKLGYVNTSAALINNLALSLNDCYWIKPVASDLKWEDVNLFNNEFEDIFGDITLDVKRNVNVKDKTIFNSATSPGELQKKWCIDKNQKRMLIKGNYGLSYQQSLNEVFASGLHKSLGFKNYVEYKTTNLTYKGGEKALGCSSYCFCNENVEAISLSNIYSIEKKRNDESNFSHLKNQCIKLGIKENEFDDYFDYLIVTDFLLTNIDRHLNNISILRNPDTLETIGFAPIYDCGNSMFYKTSIDEFDNIDIRHIRINSLQDEELKMLKYVKNRKIIDIDNIKVDFSIYDKDIKENLSRKDYYIKMFNTKVDLLKQFQSGVDIWRR